MGIKFNIMSRCQSGGFQSSSDPNILFGLGNTVSIDSVIIDWPNGRKTIKTSVTADQKLTFRQSDAFTPVKNKSNSRTTLLFSHTDQKSLIDFRHKENLFVDFERDKLLFHMSSTEGPKMSIDKHLNWFI